MDQIQTLEAALGFGAGVVFGVGIIWRFVYQPLKKENAQERDEMRAELAAERAARQDLIDGLLKRAGLTDAQP